MSMFRRTLLSLAAAGFAFAGSAVAGVDTDTFEVSITIENNCTITVDDLSFGTADDLDPAIDGATSGSVSCTAVGPVSISFDPGTGGSSSFAVRQMASGANTIDYNLYRDESRTEVLGDGSNDTFTIDFTSTGGVDAFDVYGQTAANQNPKPIGTYASTITATVEF